MYNRLITDDLLFVIETADLDLSKDAHNKVVILQIISEKIEELKMLKAVQIEDNPDLEWFLNIISNFKQSQFGKIFAVIPSNSSKKHINVKNLFRTTIALCRQDLGLPELFWFLDPFQLGSPMDQQYVLAAKREKEEQDTNYADNNLKLPATTGQSAAVINLLKTPPTTGGEGKQVSQSVSTTSSTIQLVVTPTTSITSAEAQTSAVANANKALQDSYTYRYISNYGNSPTIKFRQKGLYTSIVYTNQLGYSQYLEFNNRKKRNKSIEEGLVQFDTFFSEETGFSVSSNSATSQIITKFIADLFLNRDDLKITLVQRTIIQFFQFSHTSPERFANHWIYKSAALVNCPAARVWLEANKILGARWNLVDPTKLGPAPPPSIIHQKGVKAPHLPRGILRQKKSTLISSPFGKICFQESTNKKPMIVEDHIQSKAPRNYNTFLSIRTGKITAGYAAGESQIVHYFHTCFDLVLAVDNTSSSIVKITSFLEKLENTKN